MAAGRLLRGWPAAAASVWWSRWRILSRRPPRGASAAAPSQLLLHGNPILSAVTLVA